MTRIVVPYNPFAVHRPFHMTKAREKAAIGAVGSGKTLALCGDALGHCLEQPGSKAMLCRMTVPSLRDTTEQEFVNMISTPPDDYYGDEEIPTLYDLCKVSRSGGHIDRIHFPNGSELLFRSLDDWRKVMSQNLSWIGVDEANELDAETYQALISRLRQFTPLPAARRQGIRWGPKSTVRQQIALACNPDGHNWIWEYFIHAPTAERRAFLSSSFDNPTLFNEDGTPTAFLESLLTMPEIWIRRFVLTEFDVFAGQIYNFDFNKHTHQHFVPPDDWERGMGMDWGIRNPTALGWWARKPGTSKWYKYREWQSYDPLDINARDTATSPSVDDIVRVIRRLEGNEYIKWRGADPMIFRRQTGPVYNQTIAYFFQRQGIHFQPGAKDYDSRINAVNRLLGREEISISSSCPMTQTAYQQYRWDDLAVARGDKDQAEKPRKKDDHLCDQDQYFFTLFSQTTAPPKELPQESREQIMLNWSEDIKKKLKKGRS